MNENNLPGKQIGAFRFKVEGKIFQGKLDEAKQNYIKWNPSAKWFIWLQDNYFEISH